MSTRKIKIVTDSSSDILKLDGIDFESAPLKIITAQKEYVDNADLDVFEMATDLISYKGKSSTSCPNAGDWLAAFGDADEIYCVTITATLSGSHNAALLAKKSYEEENPGKRVFVFNSLSAGPEMALITEKIAELVAKEKSFEEICRETEEYSKKTGLLFVLESVRNLANNGRISPLVAKVAGMLGIRVVGRASEKGDLEMLDKCRGEARALESIVKHLKENGLKNGKVKLTHCFNETAAASLKKLLNKELPTAVIEIGECRGLCSFYAEKGGMLVGFEKM